MELIMEIMPNYPTIQKPNYRQFPDKCKNIFIFQNFTCSLEKKMFMRFKRCFYGFYKKDHEFKKCSQVQKLFFDSENMFTNLIKCLLLLGIEKGVDPRL
jgi:hypothetical protein